MMYRHLLVSALLTVLFVSGSNADIIEMHNGDHITGKIIEIGEEALVIETEYAGTITVLLDAVKSIEPTDGEIAAWLKDTLEPWEIEIRDIPNHEEEPEEPELERPWSGTADMGVSMRKGDTDTLDANFALRLTREWPRYILTFRLEGGYSEVESQVNTRRLRSSVRLQHYVADRWYVYGVTAAEHDPGRKLDLRLEAGAGVGYDLIRRERQRLSVDAGFDYFHERWNRYSIRELEQAKETARLERLEAGENLLTYLRNLRMAPPEAWTFGDLQALYQRIRAPFAIRAEQVTTSDDLVKVHLGLDFEQTLFQNTVLTEELLFLPQIDDWSDYRIASDLAVTTPLSDRLGLRLNLKSDYESDIGNGEDQLTHLLTIALRYSF